MVEIGATTLGSSLIGTADLNAVDRIVCWCIGASTLIWGAILKKIPLHPFEEFAKKFNLEDTEGGVLNQLHAKAEANMNKARNSIGIGKGVDQSVASLSQTLDEMERDFGQDDDDEEDEGDDDNHHSNNSDQNQVH